MTEPGRIDAEIATALMDFLAEYQPKILAPGGRHMHWMDGRPIALDVALAREQLERLADRDHAVRAQVMTEVLHFIEGYTTGPDTVAPVAQMIYDGLVQMYGEPNAERPVGILQADVTPMPGSLEWTEGAIRKAAREAVDRLG